MKKIFLFTMLAAIALLGSAQEKKQSPISFKFYGFVRNYIDFDSRENFSSNSDQFNMIPKDWDKQPSGEDINARGDIHLLSVTTRLGLNVTGPEFLNAATSAKIETDLAGFGSNNYVLRIRQAYAKMDWKNHNLLIGQAWHPMMGDMMPDVFSLATGSPFTPFSRSPQVRYNFVAKGFTFTATALYQFQYTSNGPSGSSYEYARKAIIPEGYIQLMYKNGGFMAGAGVDILTLKPRNEYINTVTSEKTLSKALITSYSPTLFLSYKGNNWGIKTRATYAQNAGHLNMLSGYAVSNIKEDGEWEYTSLNSITYWIDATYKQKLEKGSLTYCLFGGYGKNLGCNKDVLTDKMYIRGYDNIDYYWRIAPSILYTQNAMQIGLEYEPTTVGYGEKATNSNAAIKSTHTVTNHRICAMVKYNF
ncbi:MAG: hypothetical protein IKV17_01680 [Bacteroidaceae bacterium]|nr:hypothetical protein [Bacteroidaceae bacterium]